MSDPPSPNGSAIATGPLYASRQPVPLLPLIRLRLHFRATQAVRLPDYAGSMWRGAFGHALKRTVCVTKLPTCPPCLLYRSCVYPYVFETPPGPDAAKMRRYEAAPHPFVLEPDDGGDRALAPGDSVSLRLLIIGNASRYLGYFVHALASAAERGLGRGKGRLTLHGVEQEVPVGSGDWREIYRPGETFDASAPATVELPPSPGRTTLEFVTPLRLQRDGRNLTPETLRFADFFVRLMRRMSMLSQFHTDTPFETDFRALKHKAEEIGFESGRLRWHEWTRYSSRQQTTMEMGGVVGSAAVDLRAHPELWPWLWIGQFVHVGKATSMGLGRFQVTPASLPAQPDGGGG